MPEKLSRRDVFATTRWTVVVTAANADAVTHARKALAELCEIYWYPLYAYVRRRGYAPADAEDLTQACFVRLLGAHMLAAAHRERGRFRSFLLASLHHFLADEWDKAGAQKRGARQIVSLDAGSAETRYLREPADHATPESLFERQWALRLLEEVMTLLKAEYAAAGQAALFEQLRFGLTGDRSTLPYAEHAARLGMTEGAVKVAVHRLRQRYRARLREEIAHTVASPEEVEEELRFLFRALAR